MGLNASGKPEFSESMLDAWKNRLEKTPQELYEAWEELGEIARSQNRDEQGLGQLQGSLRNLFGGKAFKGDIFKKKPFGTPKGPEKFEYNQSDMADFLVRVAMIPQNQTRRRVMFRFIHIMSLIHSGHHLTNDELVLCNQYGLKNLSGAKIGSKHRLEPKDINTKLGTHESGPGKGFMDLGPTGILENCRLKFGTLLARVGSIKNVVSEANVWVREADSVEGLKVKKQTTRIDETHGDVGIESANNVNLGVVGGNTTVEAAKDVYVGTASGNVSLPNAKGNVDLGKLHGDLTVKADGRVQVKEEVKGDISILGATEVGIAKTQGLNIDVDGVLGDLTIEELPQAANVTIGSVAGKISLGGRGKFSQKVASLWPRLQAWRASMGK